MKAGGYLTLIGVAAAMVACDSDSRNPQLDWGWVTNCAGPEFTKFGGSGPGPERPVFKVTDQLVLAVPKKYHPSAGSIDREPRECRKISDLPPANHVEFVMQGDWSAGYRLQDIPTYKDGTKRFWPDRVWVRIEPEHVSTLSPEEQQKNAEIGQSLDQSRESASATPTAGYVFKAHIRTEDSRFVIDGEPRPVVSGMMAQADITTDRRRVIDFFLSPVLKYLDRGMRV